MKYKANFKELDMGLVGFDRDTAWWWWVSFFD